MENSFIWFKIQEDCRKSQFQKINENRRHDFHMFAQQKITCLNSTIERLEKGVKYDKSLFDKIHTFF